MNVKWAGLALGVVFAVLLVAACGEDDSDGNGGTNGDGTPAATATESADTVDVTLYYANEQEDPDRLDCSVVFPTVRQIPAPGDDALAEAALDALFAGPTETEAAAGFVSEFSGDTAAILISVRVDGATAYINLSDIRSIIPNASSSCGSTSFFAEVESTLAEVVTVDRVIYAIDGDPEPFYEFMQLGCDDTNDDCDTAPFE